MNNVDSRRIEMLRFPLILLIVYLHCFIAPVALAGKTVAVSPSPAVMALYAGLSNGIARIAVPAFFLLSGYLYFIAFDGSWRQYRRKSAQRFVTLVIPFVFWNLLAAAVLLAAQSIPATAAFFNSGNARLADLDWRGWMDALIGLTRAPIDYQFWFIRDLAVLAIAAPAIWQLIRIGNWLLPAACITWWALGLPFPEIPSFEAITFFVAGAYAGQRRLPPFVGDRLWPGAAITYLVLLAIEVSWSRVTGEQPAIWHRVTLLFGLVSALSLTRMAVQNARCAGLLVTLSGSSFFVFAVHEPMLTVLRKLCYRTLPVSQPMILSVYLLLPLMIAGLSVAMHVLLMRIAPGPTAIVTGGRASKGY